MEAKYRAGPVPRAGGPFPSRFRPLPARLGPHLAVPCPVRGLFPSLLCGHCLLPDVQPSQMSGALFPYCARLSSFSPNRSGGAGGRVPLSSVPGLHCSGEGVNLPVGDSPVGRGGGSGREIEQATLISALISASHCSPWGSEVMEGLSLGLHREEGAVT